jgi:2-polyprenyl-3-methyl-5-hydroxy-6-metoxy-1,4-benzoquinol methylase
MRVELQNRLCPTCGDRAASSAPAVSSVPPGESLSLEDLTPSWNRTEKKRIYLSYHRCSRCGLLYCPRYFAQAQLDSLYAGMPANTFSISVDTLRKTQIGYFEVLKQFSPLEGDFLEVGPDIGLLVESCVKEGAFQYFWLFEPNTSVQDTLRSVVKDKNFRIFPSMLNPELIPDQQLSVAVMIHVLDHLLDPSDTLKNLRRKLAPSAVLLLVTHNESSLLARLTGRKWGAYSLEHPQLLNPVSMTNLLNTAGYEVLTIRKTYNSFPLSYLLNQLMNVLGLYSVRYPFKRDVTVRLKLGNMITIASPGNRVASTLEVAKEDARGNLLDPKRG